MIRGWRAVLRVVLVMLVALAVVPSVRADAFPSNNGNLFSDNSTDTYCWGLGSLVDEAAADFAMMHSLDEDTDMSSIYEYSCNAHTDIWWWDSDLPPKIRGYHECINPGSAGECDSWDIEIDWALIDSDEGVGNWFDRRKTACHELGHTTGLTHGTASEMDDCQMKGEVPSTHSKWRRYSDHHISHIDAHY